MKPSAWTGSAWGKGPAKASDEQDYEGDDACGICLNAPEAVSLQPCKHKICESCVDRLRYQLISTAESGVKCPFCRGFVSDYKNAADEGDSFALSDAQSAARFAAKAREAAAHRKAPAQQPAMVAAHPRPHPRPQHQHQAALSYGALASRLWHCPKCRITNSQDQRECMQCSASASMGLPVTLAMVSPSVGREPVAGSRAGDLVKLCNEKHHWQMNQAFQAAGSPALEGGGVLSGSREAVLAAVKVKGQARLVHLVSTITEAGRWQDVLLHPFGSYTFQDLLLAAAYLRQHITALHEEGVVSAEAMLRALGGPPPQGDMLGMLVKPLVDEALPTLQHEKGWFVMARLNNLPDAEREIAAVLRALAPHMPGMLHLHTRASQLHKAVWRLCDALEAGTPHRREAAEGLAAIAQVFLDKPGLLLPTLQNLHSFRLPIQALHGIPQAACLKLGRHIAEAAQKISTDAFGAKALELLFYLHAKAPADQDALRDLMCLTAKHLCGSYANLAMSGTEGAKLVRAVITRLAQEGEEDWFGWVCCELTVQAKRLAGYAPGWATFMHGLAQPIMDDTSVEQHLRHLWAQVDEVLGAEASLWSTRRRLAQSHPQTPRPPSERCAVQPTVVTAPLPSPPPSPAPPAGAQPAAAPTANTAAARAPLPPAETDVPQQQQQQQQQQQAPPPAASVTSQALTAASAAAASAPAAAALPWQQPPPPALPPPPPPPDQQRSGPASVVVPAASSQVAPVPKSASLRFGSFDDVDATAAAVGGLSLSAPPNDMSLPQRTVPGSPAGRPHSRAASVSSPAASTGSSAFDMQMFFPSAGAAAAAAPQQLQQQTQQQQPPLQAAASQQVTAAPQQLVPPPPPPQQQQQQQAPPAFGQAATVQANGLQSGIPTPAGIQPGTHQQPPFSQPAGHQQSAFSQPAGQTPGLAQQSAVYQGTFGQGYSQAQQQQRQVHQPPQQPHGPQRPDFAPQPQQPPPRPQQQQQLHQPRPPAVQQPQSPHQAQVPFQQQLSWQQQELQQQAQAQQPMRAAKRATRAYQPPGAAPNGPVAAAPTHAAAPSAPNGLPPQQRPPPPRKAYNPTPAPPPPPPTANPNPSNVPGRLAIGALSSLAGSREPVTSRTSLSHANGTASAAGPAGGAAGGVVVQQQQNGWGGGGSAAERQAAPSVPPPPPAAPTARAWHCPLCTYHHTGREAEFLNCAMCGSEKP